MVVETVTGRSQQQQRHDEQQKSATVTATTPKELAVVPEEHGDNQLDGDDARPAALAERSKSGSYRILATFTPHAEVDEDNGAEDDDPMAWADLEAFGGTKKTLEKPKPARKLTPEEVREQLRELHEIERKMAEATMEKRSKKGMLDTIAWLKQHSGDLEDSHAARQKRKRSSSFVRSVLDFFHVGGRSRHNSRGGDDGNNSSVHSSRSNNNDGDDERETTATAQLKAPWGQTVLACGWTRMGYTLLNQPILEDMRRVRLVVESEELLSASPQAIISLAKWLRMFDKHVDDVIKLKEYLLEERSQVSGVGYKVTTLYNSYKEQLGATLEKIHGDRRELSEAIIQTFADLEAILTDELLALTPLVEQSLSEEQEYVAISELFHNLDSDDMSGVVVAKLLGWMKNNVDDADTQAFLALFDPDVKDKIAGEFMRHYAAHLLLLDEFSVSFEGSLAYFT